MPVKIEKTKPYFCELKSKFIEIIEVFYGVEGFIEEEFLSSDGFICPNRKECEEDGSISNCPLSLHAD